MRTFRTSPCRTPCTRSWRALASPLHRARDASRTKPSLRAQGGSRRSMEAGDESAPGSVNLWSGSVAFSGGRAAGAGLAAAGHAAVAAARERAGHAHALVVFAVEGDDARLRNRDAHLRVLAGLEVLVDPL